MASHESLLSCCRSTGSHTYRQDILVIENVTFCIGVPATLNYLPLGSAPVDEPRLIPYPDWASNREDDCDALTTTYRIRVDECDRLWVLDSGTVGIGQYHTNKNNKKLVLIITQINDEQLLFLYIQTAKYVQKIANEEQLIICLPLLQLVQLSLLSF